MWRLLLIAVVIGLSGCKDDGKSSSYANSSRNHYNQNATSDTAAAEKMAYDNNPANLEDIKADGTTMKVSGGRGQWDPPPRPQRPFTGTKRANQQRHMQMINKLANKHRIDPFFIHAITSQESHYDQNAVSHAGAAGLMQIMPATGKGLGISPSERFNPFKNVDAGIRYFKSMKWANGNLQALAAGYNSGPARAKALYLKNASSQYWRGAQPSSSNGVPSPKFWGGETHNYARNVAGYYILYKNNPQLIGLGIHSSTSGSAQDARGLN